MSQIWGSEWPLEASKSSELALNFSNKAYCLKSGPYKVALINHNACMRFMLNADAEIHCQTWILPRPE